MLQDLVGERQVKEMLDELGHFAEQMKKLGWKDLRSWNEFFSVFKIPQWNLKHIEQRVTANFLHYRSNYLALSIGICLFQIILAPSVLFSLICIGSFCVYVLVMIKGPLVVANIRINRKMKVYLCAAFSVVVLALTRALEQIFWMLVYCFILCVLHMVFRPRSVTSKANKIYEEVKITGFNWFGGGTNTASGTDDDATDVDPENPDNRLSPSVRKRTGTSTGAGGPKL